MKSSTEDDPPKVWLAPVASLLLCLTAWWLFHRAERELPATTLLIFATAPIVLVAPCYVKRVRLRRRFSSFFWFAGLWLALVVTAGLMAASRSLGIGNCTDIAIVIMAVVGGFLFALLARYLDSRVSW